MSVDKIKRSILMPLIGLLFALSTLTTPFFTTPIYADPDVSETTPDPDPAGDSISENPESTSDSEPTESTNEQGTINPSATDTSNQSQDSNVVIDSDTATSCTDQIGTISWLVCPTTGFLANIIDSLYGAIEGLLVVEPLSTNTNSPIFIVWNYARNISNIVFVILLLIVIYSQITGFGISNYGIKRTLPRIIVAAILVNLSFLLTSIAVDVSNIIGASLRDLLANIGETAIASGAVSVDVDINVADIFTAVASGGVILGISVAAAGSFSALLAILLAVILGGVISVATGLFTISLRQAVISLLVMISPLAFVAYLLPNTEKYFRKWLQIFMQMIIFYPMFSLLFGASRLAGWVIMASATNGLGIVLGIAVQIFPLFAGVSLMRMSGTALGTIGGFFAGLGARAANATRNLANEYAAERRAKYLNGTPKKFDIPRRAAQGLQNRRYRRRKNIAELTKLGEARGEAYTASSYFRNNGEVSRRGLQHADNINASMRYQRTVLRTDNHFDEGLAQFSKSGTRRHQQAVASDQAAIHASDLLKQEQARSADINLENLKGYHQRVNEAITANSRKSLGQDYDREAYARYQSILKITGERAESGINTIFANALAQKARADREIRGDYELLLQEAAYTANIDDMLADSLRAKDPNIMAAAIQTMMQRGDTDLIGDQLADLTSQFSSDTPDDLAMQKRLSDVMVGYKGDSAILWGYAKCLNMARGRAEGMRRSNRKIEEVNRQAIASGHPERVQPLTEVIPDFFTFEDYLKADGNAAKWGLNVEKMIESADESIAGTQDRTVWSFGKDHDRLFFTETQRRNALFGGVQVTGERLLSLIDMHLGKGATWNYSENGQSVSTKTNRKVLSFKTITTTDDNGNIIIVKTAEQALADARANIEAMVKGNNAGHFTKFKSDILTAFGTIMSDDYTVAPDGSIVFDLRQHKDDKIRSGLEAMVADGTINRDKISTDLHRLAQRGSLNNMNSNTRAMLNSVLGFDD